MARPTTNPKNVPENTLSLRLRGERMSRQTKNTPTDSATAIVSQPASREAHPTAAITRINMARRMFSSMRLVPARARACELTNYKRRGPLVQPKSGAGRRGGSGSSDEQQHQSPKQDAINGEGDEV